MRSKTEQIEHILRKDTETWARSQLAAGQSLADFKYTDFISATPDEVVAHVLANGFDPSAVWTPGEPNSEKDDKLVVEPQGAQWVCYYIERGVRSEERTFDSREDAVRDAVMRLLDAAWTMLNHRYWHRYHPTLPRMPDFGQPWPSQP
jgi:hypothetical protein